MNRIEKEREREKKNIFQLNLFFISLHLINK